MKRYFTRLATRASSPTTPTFPVANIARSEDPFEPRALSHDSSPTSIGENTRAERTIDNSPTRFASETSEQIQARPKRLAPAISELQPATPALVAPVVAIGTDQPPTIAQPNTSAGTARTAAARRNDSTARVTTRKDSSPTPESVRLFPVHSTKKSGTNAAQAPSEEAGSIPSSGAEAQTDQATLLRKADVFMAQILDRQSPSERPQKIDAHDERAVIMNPPTVPSSLPAAPTIKPIEGRLKPAPDQPSVVIGRLTVEVVPPPPPPVARPPMGHARATRRGPNTVPSGRRFGLSQF